MPSVKKLSFLEHTAKKKAEKLMQNKPRKVRRQFGSDVDENRGGIGATFPLSPPPVRVNQGELNVEGHLIITVQITIGKRWNL